MPRTAAHSGTGAADSKPTLDMFALIVGAIKPFFFASGAAKSTITYLILAPLRRVV